MNVQGVWCNHHQTFFCRPALVSRTKPVCEAEPILLCFFCLQLDSRFVSLHTLRGRFFLSRKGTIWLQHSLDKMACVCVCALVCVGCVCVCVCVWVCGVRVCVWRWGQCQVSAPSVYRQEFLVPFPPYCSRRLLFSLSASFSCRAAAGPTSGRLSPRREWQEMASVWESISGWEPIWTLYRSRPVYRPSHFALLSTSLSKCFVLFGRADGAARSPLPSPPPKKKVSRERSRNHLSASCSLPMTTLQHPWCWCPMKSSVCRGGASPADSWVRGDLTTSDGQIVGLAIRLLHSADKWKLR